jgi:hypothetical protein
MVENGLYRISDAYYIDFPHDKHIHIKNGRPFYYVIKDNHGIYWFIPLSTQVETYRKKIRSVEIKRGEGRCLAFHIGIITGREMAFRICDMIPVTEKYIDGAFEKYGSHYIVKDKALITAINRKARNYINLLKCGQMYSQVDALAIREKLIANEI